MAQVRFHRAARSELERAFAWYEKSNPEAAARFMLEVRDQAKRIAEAPERWPVVRGTTRRLTLDGFPFSIVYRYRAAEGLVWIVAVAHQRRRPDYWRGR
jgi:toxin ParE1/3/4